MSPIQFPFSFLSWDGGYFYGWLNQKKRATELERENEKLKAEIRELKAEIERLKKIEVDAKT
jgi:cell division protein FtsB